VRGCIAISLLLATAVGHPAFGEEMVVIVHGDRNVPLDVDELAQIYLKKRRYWEDGKRIVPVNQDSASTIRDDFVRAVFGTDSRELVPYWNRQYFRGVLPPATLASDEAVVRFVASEPLAIGYVRPSAVDESVRVVLSLDASGR